MNNISSIFNNTTNSYKFYWWLAIMELIKAGKTDRLSFEDIVFQIIAKIWYPVNYSDLSFGKLDQFSKYVLSIKDEYGLSSDIKESELLYFLVDNKDDEFIKSIVLKITRYVPYRFLRTWFSYETRGLKDSEVNDAIINLQDTKKEEIPYIIDLEHKTIILNSRYVKYILENYRLIESFTYFELLKYVEKKNLNVTNISVKLFKPKARSLNPTRRKGKGLSH